MVDKQAKSKRRKKNDSGTKFNELSLDDVLAVGGDEEVFEMVKDVDVSSDFVADDGLPEDVDKKEITSYIKQLGLNELHHMPHRKDLKEIFDDDMYSADQPKEVAVSNNQGQKEKKGKTQGFKGIEKTQSSITVPVVPVSERKLSSHAQRSSASVRKRSPHQKMLMKSVALWTDQMPEVKGENPDLNHTDVAQLQEEALVLLENEVHLYEKDKAKDKSTDSQWLKSVVRSGTLKDKVTALTVQIQESPVHQLKTLDILLSMAKKKGRRESIIAVDMLKELWMTLLLPENRKLKTFCQNPLSSLQNVVQSGGGWDERDRKLILWCFEEQLKERYKEFIEVVERLLRDTLVNIRSKSLGIVYDLLSEKPEQEQVLLGLLINKIGDPDRKVASKAVYLARCLVTKHPNMKSVVTKEIEKLLYRANVAMKAQYYAVCFLNQLILTKKDKELATRLISIYLSFFGTFLRKGDLEAKMLSALLTGVNRAFPYAKEEDEKYNQQLDTLFRAVHIGTFNTSVQALMLLYQVMESRQSVSDRFYRALYAKLLDPNLKTSSKQTMFLNVLYKSLKNDPSLCRVKAFVKRILQACSFQQPSFICGTLFMISELTKLKPGIRSLTQHPEEKDDEEHFVDAPDDDDDLNKDTDPNNEGYADRRSRHVDIPECQQSGSHIAKAHLVHAYKPHQRNPLYSGAENSCLWELNRLARHYHPSVCHFASTLINSDEIEYNGDPLQDFTLMRFLDRFVYKNPKEKDRDHGGSLMQPRRTSSRLQEEPVNSKAFVTKKEENVREDEIFFYRYFKQKAEKKNLKKKDSKRKDDEMSDEENTNFDNIQESVNQEFDFASVLQSKAPVAKKNKSKKGEDEDESDEELDESEEDDHVEQENGSSDDGFDYEAMELSSAEEDEEGTGNNKAAKRKFTNKDYEKALLDNLSSDEFSDNESQTKKSKKNRGGTDVSSMFASAEKFSHLLENSQASRGGSYDVMRNGASDKQLKWEDKKAGKHWRKGRNLGRGRGGGQGEAPKHRNFNNRKGQRKFTPKGRGVRGRR